jgi:hypothetical protein
MRIEYIAPDLFSFQMLVDIEAVELGYALEQQEEFLKRKVSFERQLRERTIREELEE